jgi:hypothetical protein
MTIQTMTELIVNELDKNIDCPEHLSWWSNKLSEAIGHHKIHEIYILWRILQEEVISKIPDIKTNDTHLCEITHKHLYDPCYIDQNGYDKNLYYEKSVIMQWLKLQGTSGFLPYNDNNKIPFSLSCLKRAGFADQIETESKSQIVTLIYSFRNKLTPLEQKSNL